MRVMHFDRKNGEMKVVVETIDDLWHLEKIIDSGDVVEGRTMRTVKIGTKEEKKPVFIGISVENVEFAKAANRLRVRGKIIYGNPEEFVQMGRYHTIDVGEGTKIKIKKEWKDYQIKRLKQAEKESKRPKIRIIVMDDEKALTAILRGYGVDYGPEFYNPAGKRDDDYDKKSLQYFGDVAAEISRHPEKYVVAGPGFAKDNLKDFIKKKDPELLKKIVFETCSYAERSGVNELLKRGAIEKIAGEERVEKETKLIEEAITQINKDTGLIAYGIEEVKKAADMHAIEKLLILDEFLRTSEDAEKVTENAEKGGAEIVIFSIESDPGLKLKGFGKIVAFLRYKIGE